MKLRFIPPSDQELIDAYYYYEDQLSGLGDQFLCEFNKTIELILEYPGAWIRVGKRTRRALLKRYPFLILYIYEDDTVHITCVAYQHRDPEYYIGRIV